MFWRDLTKKEREVFVRWKMKKLAKKNKRLARDKKMLRDHATTELYVSYFLLIDATVIYYSRNKHTKKWKIREMNCLQLREQENKYKEFKKGK